MRLDSTAVTLYSCFQLLKNRQSLRYNNVITCQEADFTHFIIFPCLPVPGHHSLCSAEL